MKEYQQIQATQSASATGSTQVNERLSRERAAAPEPIIDQYLVNVPHQFFRVYGLGDVYSPKDANLTVDERYQNVMGEQLVVGGDIILKVQGIPVGEAADHRRVRDIRNAVPPGAEFTMTILRLGQVGRAEGRHL